MLPVKENVFSVIGILVVKYNNLFEIFFHLYLVYLFKSSYFNLRTVLDCTSEEEDKVLKTQLKLWQNQVNDTNELY